MEGFTGGKTQWVLGPDHCEGMGDRGILAMPGVWFRQQADVPLAQMAPPGGGAGLQGQMKSSVWDMEYMMTIGNPGHGRPSAGIREID